MSRVILITDFFRPEPGGLEGYLTSLARHWEHSQIEVIVTAKLRHYLNRQSDVRLFDQNERYLITRVSLNRNRFRFGKRRVPPFERYLTERIHAFAPDHLLIGNLMKGATAIQSISKKMNVPYSFILSSYDVESLRLSHFRKRKCVHEAENIFAFSKQTAERITKIGFNANRVHVLPPSIIPRWNNQRKNSLPEEMTKRINGKDVLLGVGPFLQRKGFDTIIYAMQKLGRRLDSLHLVLVGSGPEYPYLKELIRIGKLEESVTLTGFLRDSDLALLYSRADLVVEPGNKKSKAYSDISNIFMEAAWFGVPIIAGRSSAAEEVIQNGVTGYLCEPGNSEELSAYMLRILDTPKLKKEMAKNARSLALSRYDMESTCYAMNRRLQNRDER